MDFHNSRMLQCNTCTELGFMVIVRIVEVCMNVNTSLPKGHRKACSTHIAKVRFANCYSVYTGHLHTPHLQGQSTFQHEYFTISSTFCKLLPGSPKRM